MRIQLFSKSILSILFVVILSCCKEQKKEQVPEAIPLKSVSIEYAQGFAIEKLTNGITTITITSPWPNAKNTFTYALVPKEKKAAIRINKDAYDAVISVPVDRIITTSTTHIPALEALGVADKLVGFPNTKYVSSSKTRKRIDDGFIKELGINESLNTEMVIELKPDVVIGFSIDDQNKTYQTIQRSGIAVVYNGDWTEQTPLGKAEWIKFFAPFFGKEVLADSIFNKIKNDYKAAKTLAKTAKQKPTVMSGAMYKDVWYLPGGKSWAAEFLEDANATYLWNDTVETGSLSLSWETVLVKSSTADFWVSPSQFTTYSDMSAASKHYAQFEAFQNKNVFTYSSTTGVTGGLLYFELAPQRPDLVLKDLIHIFHPELLPNYENTFFKPLE